MNALRQDAWDKGHMMKATPLTRPPDSINFGQGCQYTSEAKSTFVSQDLRASRSAADNQQLQAKYRKPNINFGSPVKDQMKTVAMAKDEDVSRSMGRQNIAAMNQDQKEKSKQFSTQMRAANFKMGSHLPETNSFKPSTLERAQSGTIGLVHKQPNFRPRSIALAPQSMQQVSAGNNIAKGGGSFKTINQSFVNWIQPSAVARVN